MTDSPERPNEPKPPSRRALLALCALGALAASAYLGAELFVLGEPTFPLDDPWIHLELARSLAGGEGIGFQGRSSWSPSLLWTALLAPAALWPTLGVLWTKLLGVGLHLAGLIALAYAARAWSLSPLVSGLVVVLVATSPRMLWSALSGLEIPLFVVLSLLGTNAQLRAHQRERFPWSTLWLSLAALSRPEGLLLLLLSWIDRGLRLTALEPRGRENEGPARTLIRHAGVAAVLLGPLVLFNLARIGTVWPTTLDVRAEASWRLLPRSRDLWEMGIVLFPQLPWMMLLLFAGMVLAAARRRSLLPCLWVVALPCLLSMQGGQVHRLHEGRLLLALLPFIALIGALALDSLVEALPATLRCGALRVPLPAVVGLILLLPTLASVTAGLDRYLAHSARMLDGNVAAGRWAAKNLPADAVVAAQEVGAMAYYAPQKLVDIFGVVDPGVLPYLYGDLQGEHPSGLGGWATFLRRREVDFVVVDPRSYWGGLAAVRDVLPGARVVRSFESPGDGGNDELLLLATPWSRP